MEIDRAQLKAFLYELYTQTNGDPDARASMQDIAATLGIDAEEAGEIAQSLYIQELAELKSLSGGMGITAKGLETLNINVPHSPGNRYALPAAETLDAEDKKAIAEIIDRIKISSDEVKGEHAFWEQYILDIKSIELQLLSPAPRTQAVKQLFISLKNNRLSGDNASIKALLDDLIQ